MFDVGAFTSGLLTGLREGVEAALIVAIVCSYLARTGNARHFGKIWVGVGAAVAASFVLGAVIFVTVGGLEEPYEQIFEGLTMLVAAGVVTWMLFWMRRQASSVKGDLQRAVDRVLTEGTAWGLAVLAFTRRHPRGPRDRALPRRAGDRRGRTGARATPGRWPSSRAPWSASAIAVAIGYGFYRGSRALDIRTFFRWTGVLLIFIAAGLLSHAVHEFVEIGWITVGTATGVRHRRRAPPRHGDRPLPPGDLRLHVRRPSGSTFVTWVAYVVVVLALYLRPVAPRPPEPRCRAAPRAHAAAPAAGLSPLRPRHANPAGLGRARYPTPTRPPPERGPTSSHLGSRMPNNQPTGGQPSPTRRDRREAARRDQRLAAARTAAPKPAWQSPMVLLTVGAVAVGLVVVLVASGVLGGRGAASTGELLVPIRPTPTELVDPTNPRALGPAGAPVTVEVWSDFQCPACGFFAKSIEPDLIDEYVRTGDVQPGLPRQGLPRRRRPERGIPPVRGGRPLLGRPGQVLAVPRLPHSRTRTARTRARSTARRSTRSPRRWAWTWTPSGPAWRVTPRCRLSWTRLPREQPRA